MLRSTLSPRIGRSLFKQSFRPFPLNRRYLNSVPGLSHDYKHGVPGLLSEGGFDLAWTQYQQYVIERLNSLTAGGEWDSRTPKDILIAHARDPAVAPIFNYASMAHNNHFFFNCLTPNPTPIPEALKEQLEASFSSIDTLKREMVATAAAMFGPGFVWLVQSKNGSFNLLTTYLAGSPYPQAHYRQQSVDMNTEDKSVSEAMRRKLREQPVGPAGAHGARSETPLAPGAADIKPVLCINTWEHVYLQDYGVGAFGVGGKKVYAESWWQAIDWDVVAHNAQSGFGSSRYMR